MGWADSHLYEFECNGSYYGESDDWSDRPIALARNAKLKAMAARAKDGAFLYVYDFGDGWEHRIVVEATGLEKADPCPRFIDGATACPPEDIGGIPGYAALKAAAIGEQDEHDQYLLESLDGEFDPEALDVHLSSTDRGASTVQDVMDRSEASLLLSLYASQVLHGLRCLLERQAEGVDKKRGGQ